MIELWFFVKVMFSSVISFIVANEWMFVVAGLMIFVACVWEAITRPTVEEGSGDDVA